MFSEIKVFRARGDVDLYLNSMDEEELNNITLQNPPEVVEDLSIVCRVCLGDKTEMHDIFSRITIGLFDAKEIIVELDEILQSVGDIEINKNDRFPQHICDDCIVQMSNAFLFREKCKSSDILMRNYCDGVEMDPSVHIVPIQRELTTSQTTTTNTKKAFKPRRRRTRRKKIKQEPDCDENAREIVENGDEDASLHYKCGVCSKVFAYRGIRDIHMKRTHKIVFNFNCKKCKFATSSQFLWNAHERQHKFLDSTMYKCTVCNETIPKRQEESHRNSHIKSKRHRCAYCNHIENKTFQMEFHMKFQCKTADEFFSAGGEHPDEHAAVNGLIIEKPGGWYRVYRLTRSTWELSCLQHKFKCGSCFYKFQDKASLNSHACGVQHAAAHNDFVCSECGLVLSSKKEFQSHMMEHKTNHYETYKCDSCDQEFANISHLQSHSLLEHPVEIETNLFGCLKCDETFSTPSARISHMNTNHPTRKKIKCSRCPTQFANQIQLNKHMKIVHGQRKMHCSICNVKFETKYEYSTHYYEMHSGKNNYHCINCDKTFATSLLLNKHIQKVCSLR